MTSRKIQDKRFEKYEKQHSYVQMPGKMIREVYRLDGAGMTLLKKAMEKLQLSVRAYDQILKLASTAADMDGSERNFDGACCAGDSVSAIGYGRMLRLLMRECINASLKKSFMH